MGNYFIAAIVTALLISGCGPFIKDEAIPGLMEFENQTFRAKKKTDTLNEGLPFEELPFSDTTDIRLLVATSDRWIKIYGYADSGNDSRLTAKRYLILYMFEDDFPDKRFDPELLKRRLYSVVEIKEKTRTKR